MKFVRLLGRPIVWLCPLLCVAFCAAPLGFAQSGSDPGADREPLPPDRQAFLDAIQQRNADRQEELSKVTAAAEREVRIERARRTAPFDLLWGVE